MTNEEKQALIEWLKPQIHELETARDEIPLGLNTDDEMQLQVMKVALAALTTQPDDWQQRAEAAGAELKSVTESRDQWKANAHEFSRCADRIEAKLAELEKQKPVGTVSIAMDWNTHRNVATVNMRHDLVVSEMKDGDELFTRPAPAVDLAKLVPDDRTFEDYCTQNPEMTMGDGMIRAAEWNACRGAILRNIEEVQKT